MSKNNNHKIKILLAVWGERFIKDFLKFSLPTLLAPGNVPSLVHEYPTKFAILTRSKHIDFFEASPVFQKLKMICQVEFISIDDLITLGNYSTTMTLAYDHAVRMTGNEMLNTYFIFLVSDYIMADGSLAGLLRYIKKGYSGICAGNFQVIQEEMEDYFLDQINPITHVMQIKPRDLLRKSFTKLHPVTVASMIDQNACHNYHANRFFSKYNQDVIAGRFYLLHMLCIKPETMDYKVGASCDYSFIPEMCPSGNIGVINDSDDYLVIEMQPKKHELNFVNWGPYNMHHLTSLLSEWTTLQHRHNSKQTIYFHSRDVLPMEKADIEKQLNQFIDKITPKLDKIPPKPYYNHPYWIGAIEAFKKQRLYFKSSNDYEYVGLAVYDYATTLPKKIYYKFFGTPPFQFPWHFRFREYQLMRKFLRETITSENSAKTLVLYETYYMDFMRYCEWIKKKLKVMHHYHLHNLLDNSKKITELQQEKFNICIIFITLDGIDGGIVLALQLLKNILSNGGKLFIIIPNDKHSYPKIAYDFQNEFGYKLTEFYNSNYQIKNVTTINNTLTMLGAMAISTINNIFSYSKIRRFLAYILVGSLGTLFSLVCNCFSRLKKNSGHCTHIVLTLSPSRGNNES